MNDINITVTPGPTVFNTDNQAMHKYLTIGVKYSQNIDNDIDNDIDIDSSNYNLIEEMMLRIKTEILKIKKNKLESLDDKNSQNEFDTSIISLTDNFFEYLKNNDTKIQAIRVSLNDYDQDHKEQKLRTLKTKMMVITADEQSMKDTFDTIVKQLYYEFGDTVIDLYSVILTPKMYKIINTIPVEYRGVLIRVKK
jgi:hypothetical protein